jgi:hypothetical protein
MLLIIKRDMTTRLRNYTWLHDDEFASKFFSSWIFNIDLLEIEFLIFLQYIFDPWLWSCRSFIYIEKRNIIFLLCASWNKWPCTMCTRKLCVIWLFSIPTRGTGHVAQCTTSMKACIINFLNSLSHFHHCNIHSDYALRSHLIDLIKTIARLQIYLVRMNSICFRALQSDLSVIWQFLQLVAKLN